MTNVYFDALIIALDHMLRPCKLHCGMMSGPWKFYLILPFPCLEAPGDELRPSHSLIENLTIGYILIVKTFTKALACQRDCCV